MASSSSAAVAGPSAAGAPQPAAGPAEEDEALAWLATVVQRQSLENPGWLTAEDDFERLRGCVPEWASSGFTWRVLTLMGLYSEVQFNLHFVGEQAGCCYVQLCFTMADFSMEPLHLQPKGWEEWLSCGHIYSGGQFTILLTPSGHVAHACVDPDTFVFEDRRNLDGHIVLVAESLCGYLQRLRKWLEECLHMDAAAYQEALAAMKPGPHGPSGSAVSIDIEAGRHFSRWEEYAIQHRPAIVAAEQVLEPIAEFVPKKRKAMTFTCINCDKEGKRKMFECCSGCGENIPEAWFCKECVRQEGIWCRRCNMCYQCCSLGHDMDEEGAEEERQEEAGASSSEAAVTEEAGGGDDAVDNLEEDDAGEGLGEKEVTEEAEHEQKESGETVTASAAAASASASGPDDVLG